MITFRYTKKNGDVSLRTGVVLLSPRKNYLIADLSKLSMDERFAMVSKLEELKMEHDQLLAEVEIRYKSFIPEQMKIIS